MKCKVKYDHVFLMKRVYMKYFQILDLRQHTYGLSINDGSTVYLSVALCFFLILEIV